MMKRIRPGEGERQGEDEARVQLTSAEEDNQDSPVTQTFEQEEEIVAVCEYLSKYIILV